MSSSDIDCQALEAIVVEQRLKILAIQKLQQPMLDQIQQLQDKILDVGGGVLRTHHSRVLDVQERLRHLKVFGRLSIR